MAGPLWSAFCKDSTTSGYEDPTISRYDDARDNALLNELEAQVEAQNTNKANQPSSPEQPYFPAFETYCRLNLIRAADKKRRSVESRQNSD